MGYLARVSVLAILTFFGCYFWDVRVQVVYGVLFSAGKDIVDRLFQNDEKLTVVTTVIFSLLLSYSVSVKGVFSPVPLTVGIQNPFIHLISC